MLQNKVQFRTDLAVTQRCNEVNVFGLPFVHVEKSLDGYSRGFRLACPISLKYLAASCQVHDNYQKYLFRIVRKLKMRYSIR